jgi:hypothetical protein
MRIIINKLRHNILYDSIPLDVEDINSQEALLDEIIDWLGEYVENEIELTRGEEEEEEEEEELP